MLADVWWSFLPLSLEQKLADFPFPEWFPLEFLWKKIQRVVWGLASFWEVSSLCFLCLQKPQVPPCLSPCHWEQRGARFCSLGEGGLTFGVIFMCLRQGENVLLLAVSSRRVSAFQGEELEGKSEE